MSFSQNIDEQARVVMLEDQYYVGEYGFFFTIKTGIDLTAVVEGEIRGVLRRPNGSTIHRNIPRVNVTDQAVGKLLFQVESGDFTSVGDYHCQVFVRDVDVGIVRPSHVFGFQVVEGLTISPGNLFA